MTANILPNEREQNIDMQFNPTKKMEWVVRENPTLQAELNSLPNNGKEISSKVVNKVLDCIKEL